ncbi:MAG: host attachment protein [Nitrospirota bacterium]
MEKIIIITADLGHFKVYRVTKDPLEKSPGITLIESYDSIEGHVKLGDKLSDAAGRFRRGGGKDEAAKGSGERHNIKLETEKRIIKMIAKDIDTYVVSEKCDKWFLAAGKKINRNIIERLKPEIKAKMVKNLSVDLTKVKKSEILGYFK